jgi:hypothetical protein
VQRLLTVNIETEWVGREGFTIEGTLEAGASSGQGTRDTNRGRGDDCFLERTDDSELLLTSTQGSVVPGYLCSSVLILYFKCCRCAISNM